MQFRCERLYMNIRLVACYLIQKSQSSVLMALLIHRLCYQKKGVIHVISKESIFSFETDYLIALRLMILIILLLSFLGDGKLLIEVIQQAISLVLNIKNSFSGPHNSGSVHSHFVKSVHIWRFSGPYFPTFGLLRMTCHLVKMYFFGNLRDF